jgi:hypothetical protein
MSIKQNITSLQNLLEQVNALPDAGSGGIELPELTNPAEASDILENKEVINANGSKIIGAMPNNGTITSTMDGIDIKSITIPEGYTSGGTVSLDDTIDNEVDTQADLIAQIVNVLENKAAGEVVEQATPVISVNSSGLITATAGDKYATKQLTTQAAKTITPNTSS